MDEILFENAFTLDEELSAEIVKMQLGVRRPIFLIIGILMELYILQCAVFSFLLDYHSPFYLLMSLFWMGFILFIFFRPRIAAKQHMRRCRKFYDQAIPEIHVRFAREELIAQTGDQLMKLPYQKLNDVKISKHLMMLRVKKLSYVVIHKDGFTQGTYEEFLAFLKARCPNLKLPG